MTYPPSWRVIEDRAAAAALLREHPFALLITDHTGLCATRIPFVADLVDGAPVRLRGHLNAHNPQAQGLNGGDALVVFDGHATYVSPNWRTDLTRAATFDYEQVQVRGRVTVMPDIGFFRRQVDDLSAMIEPQYTEVGDYPVWQSSMSPAGYVERLFPGIVAFEIEIRSIQMISKLHQAFPEADRRSIARHLGCAHSQHARAIGAKIAEGLPKG